MFKTSLHNSDSLEAFVKALLIIVCNINIFKGGFIHSTSPAMKLWNSQELISGKKRKTARLTLASFVQIN